MPQGVIQVSINKIKTQTGWPIHQANQGNIQVKQQPQEHTEHPRHHCRQVRNYIRYRSRHSTYPPTTAYRTQHYTHHPCIPEVLM